jgi:uncharacterized protein (TIGR03435 family)
MKSKWAALKGTVRQLDWVVDHVELPTGNQPANGNLSDLRVNFPASFDVLKSMTKTAMFRPWLLVVVASRVWPLPAQTPVEFEVASIRPHVFKSDPGSESSETNVLPGGRFTGRNVTVRKMIRNAFGVDDFQISGAPGWIDSESYDIEAKTAGGVEITRENIGELMESLLKSRFQFQYHRETRETAEYALETVKGGSRLRPDTGDDKPSLSTNFRSGAVTLKATKISVQDFALALRRQVGRPVADKTGLFDFDLTWSSDQAPESAGPSIFTALQELGLRLVSTKGAAETIVVDRVEKASEN